MSGDEEYIESWATRVIANAPKDETPEQVLASMGSCPYLNRGRWAAYVVRLGAAQRRRNLDEEVQEDVEASV